VVERVKPSRVWPFVKSSTEDEADRHDEEADHLRALVEPEVARCGLDPVVEEADHPADHRQHDEEAVRVKITPLRSGRLRSRPRGGDRHPPIVGVPALASWPARRRSR
jgi:hypothetical protein